MKFRAYFFLFITIISFSGCHRQPKASFTTDKTSYNAGEVIHLKNTSINGRSYVWTLPNGQATTKDVDYQTNTSDPVGNLIFRLKALSKNGKKVDETERTVAILPPVNPKGSVVFWCSSGTSSNLPINISLSNNADKQIILKYATAPDCDGDYATYKDLEPGEYTWSGYSSNVIFAGGTITVTANSCLKVNVYQ
jgi:hypothetical protein